MNGPASAGALLQCAGALGSERLAGVAASERLAGAAHSERLAGAAHSERLAGAAWDEPRPGRAIWAGRMSHDDGLRLQLGVHEARTRGDVPDTLLLLEHDSVYTAGTAADEAHFLVAPEQLEREGHAVRRTSRGGDVTWHGPGQLVCYPILDLGDGRRDVHEYLRRLEDALILAAAMLGVPAWREGGRTGAWCAGGKIAAVGIRVSRWVTLHGTALNVAPDLSRFDAIVPCGLQDRRVTSVLRETGRAPSIREAARAHAAAFAGTFALELPGTEPEPLHVG